jgi:hypothetical protein
MTEKKMSGPRIQEDPFPSPREGAVVSCKTVGEMPPEQFITALFTMVAALLKSEKVVDDPKNPRIMSLTLEEFTELSMSHVRMRALEGAVQEESIAKRILMDWSALQSVSAVTMPSRIKSADEAVAFGMDMAEFFKTGGRGSFVIAVGIVSEEGGIRRHEPR